jgi:hypothetical protein
VLLVSAIQKMQFCQNWGTLPPVKGSGLLCLWQKNASNPWSQLLVNYSSDWVLLLSKM